MAWHLNPWEKVSKDNLLKALTEVKSLINHYEKYYPWVYKHIVPKELHKAISNLSNLIKKCENFYAWYQDISGLYEAIEELNQPETMKDPQRAAKAFGKLFIACAVLAAKVPGPAAKYYSQVLELFGKKFGAIVDTFSPDHGNKDYAKSLRRFTRDGVLETTGNL